MDVPQFSPEYKKPLKLGKSIYFPANDFSLTEKEIEKAREELRETEEKIIRKLQELRDKLANDKEIRYRTDTPHLLRYLRVRKYDSDKAYRNIKESYVFKKSHPDLWQKPENLEQLLNRNILIYMPYTDENGNILFFFDIDKWNCHEMTFAEALNSLTTVSDVIMMNPRMQVNGAIGVWDMKGLTVHHIATLLRNFSLRELCFSLQNMYPWRLKKILAFNSGRLTRQLFNMVRPFLNKKFSERIILLGSDLKELHQHVNPALLPKKLGGFLEDEQCSVTQVILDNISYIKYERSFS